VRFPSNNSLQLRPSISANAKVCRRPPLCHPDWSAAEGRDLQCALPSNISLQLRPSISTNAKVCRRPPLCHPEAYPRDLRFALMEICARIANLDSAG